MDLFVASAGVVDLPQVVPDDGDWSRFGYVSRQRPTGERHAFERGAPVTLCGLAVRNLQPWFDAQWPGTDLQHGDSRCAECARMARTLTR